MTITTSMLAVLESAEHMADVLDAALKTNRLHRKRDAERCAAVGLLEKLSCVLVDDDGCTVEPERWGPGYRLTDKGREFLRRYRHAGMKP